MATKSGTRKRISAGLLMYRVNNKVLEVLLAHPGGPFFKNKDDGYWSIPKGEPSDNEADLLETAKREFEEETGIVPYGEFIPLESIVQKGGKQVFCWAFEGNLPDGFIHKCNYFETEWPPHSGKKMQFMEIDKIEFFPAIKAKKKIKDAQIKFIAQLEKYISEISNSKV
jgi:predicted NUDIX family NTP pyrophosphohydrolase